MKHVLGSIYVFFTFVRDWSHAGGGGFSQGLKGLVHNLVIQFFTLDSSKIEAFETYFFDIVIM